MEAGNFREDLFYRIVTFSIVVPLAATVIAVFAYSLPCAAQSEVFDGRYEGLILGVGVGYSIGSSRDSGLATGVMLQGKIGFGMSDRFFLYFSTLIPSLTPGLGSNYFPKADSRLDYHDLLGYTTGGPAICG